MAAAGNRDRAELLFGRAELDHVPPHDRGEVHGLREPTERHFEVLLERLRGVHFARAARHRAALRGPGHWEHVEHVCGLAITDRPGREVRRGGSPGHAAAPRRRPHLVRGAEVLAEGVDVEVGEGA